MRCIIASVLFETQNPEIIISSKEDTKETRESTVSIRKNVRDRLTLVTMPKIPVTANAMPHQIPFPLRNIVGVFMSPLGYPASHRNIRIIHQSFYMHSRFC